jgi:hypothetical protein
VRIVFALEYNDERADVTAAADTVRPDYLWRVLGSLVRQGQEAQIVGPDVRLVRASRLVLPETDAANIERALQDTGKDPASWWTARFLQLCAKSDPEHLEALRFAAPDHVAAWEAWRNGPYKDPNGFNEPERRDPRA